MDALLACRSAYMCLLGACGGQKGVSDHLGLVLQRVVSCHVGTRTKYAKQVYYLAAEPFLLLILNHQIIFLFSLSCIQGLLL